MIQCVDIYIADTWGKCILLVFAEAEPEAERLEDVAGADDHVLEPALASLLGEVEFTEFVNMDEDLQTSANFVREGDVDDAEDDDTEETDECDTNPPINTQTALSYIEELIKYGLCKDSSDIVNSAYALRAAVENEFHVNRQKQTKIIDFFKK